MGKSAKNKKRRCCKMEMKTYQPLNCPLCGAELLSEETIRGLTQAIGRRVGVGKSLLFCDECNTRVGLVVVSDAHEWVLFVVAAAFLEDTFDLLIQLRENYCWSIGKIRTVMGKYMPKALS
jgi:transcription elongation factor Elf1